MNYHVGWNFPGYPPESEPMCFKEESAALQYLQSEARSLADCWLLKSTTVSARTDTSHLFGN